MLLQLSKALEKARENGTAETCSVPRVLANSEEGKRILRDCISIERSSALVRAAKEANRGRHDGLIVCEGCDFANEKRAMFDAHHLDPIHAGVRVSTVEDFAVLCPTCHRWAHELAQDRLQPLTVAQLRKAEAAWISSVDFKSWRARRDSNS